MGRTLRNIGSALALSVPLVLVGCRSVDRDFDRDGNPNTYIIARDGSRYATHSSEERHSAGTMWHYHGNEQTVE